MTTDKQPPLTESELDAMARPFDASNLHDLSARAAADVRRLRLELAGALTPDSKALLASRDRVIAELRNDNARLVKAAGRMAGEVQHARDDLKSIIVDMLGLPECASMSAVQTAIGSLRAECDMHQADVLRLEGLVESRGLSAMPGHEGDAREMVSAASMYGLAARWRGLYDDGSVSAMRADELTAFVRKNLLKETVPAVDVDPESPTYEQCVEHMRKGGTIQAVGHSLKRRLRQGPTVGEIFERTTLQGEWEVSGLDEINRKIGMYRLLPVDPPPKRTFTIADVKVGDRVRVDWSGVQREGEVMRIDCGHRECGQRATPSFELSYEAVEPVGRKSWSDFASIVEVLPRDGGGE